MSLLPGEMIPQTVPFGKANADGTITISKDWWLLLYNVCQQILSGQGSALTEFAELGALSFLQARGPDEARMIADLTTWLASLPNPAGRIATLEKRVTDLENLLFSEVH